MFYPMNNHEIFLVTVHSINKPMCRKFKIFLFLSMFFLANYCISSFLKYSLFIFIMTFLTIVIENLTRKINITSAFFHV